MVLIGHCTFYTISTKYGGIDVTASMESLRIKDTVVHKVLSEMCSLIYTFHMPLFMALSGALYVYDKSESINTLARKKFKRLIVPFLVATSISVTIKIISGYYTNHGLLLNNIIIGDFFIQGNTHLWFLPTLFCEFLIFYLLKKCQLNQKLLLVIFVFFNVVASKIPIVLFYAVLRDALYFYVGYLFENGREKYNRLNTIVCFWLHASLFILFLILKSLIEFDSLWGVAIRKVTTIIISLLGMIACYDLCTICSKKRIYHKLVQLINKYSFGLYLYACSVNYLIIKSYLSFFAIDSLGTNVGTFGLFICRLLLTAFSGCCITKIINRFHLKYLT